MIPPLLQGNRVNLNTVEIKAFVPARDLELSLAFYKAIGFEIPFSDETLAYVRHGEPASCSRSSTSPNTPATS